MDEGLSVSGAEVVLVSVSEAPLTGFNYAHAFNRAAIEAQGQRLALTSSRGARALGAGFSQPGQILVMVNDGGPSRRPPDPRAPPRFASEAGLAAAAGRVEAILLPRRLLVDAGGLDEDLGRAIPGLSPLLADLAMRLMAFGQRVELVETGGETGTAPGEAGFATGSILRAQSSRAGSGRSSTTKSGATIVARTLRDLALKRVGVRKRRDLTGYDLTGLLAGFTRSPPTPRPPAIGSLPQELEETLEEHGVVEARPRPSVTPGREELFALHDAHGLARLALWVRHHPPPGLRAQLETRESYRLAASRGGAWAPRLHACAEVSNALLTVESLHEGGLRRDPLLAHLEAERWLEQRAPCRRATVGEGRQLGHLAREAVGRSRALDRSVEGLANLPAVPQHGGLRTEAVVIGPGRTVLLGWEHWTELGLPGFDGLHLGFTTAWRRFGASGPRALVGHLLAGSGDPMLEAFDRDLDRLQASEHREAIVLGTLLLLARREREAEERFEPSRSRMFRDALECWLVHGHGE